MNSSDLDLIDMRRLAAAVITRALVDATSHARSYKRGEGVHVMNLRKQQARAFLLTDDALHTWAHFAGLDVDALRERLRAGLLDGTRAGGRRLRYVLPRRQPQRPPAESCSL